MNIKELYFEAFEHDEKPLILLLDFLLNDKKVINLTDSLGVLDIYLSDKNRDKMNEHLKEYIKRLKGRGVWQN